MSKNNDMMIGLEGIVTKCLPNSKFNVEVKLNDGISRIILCTISGKIRQSKIRILTGDSVDIEVSPYDLSKGRIIWRN